MTAECSLIEAKGYIAIYEREVAGNLRSTLWVR
jgi:hypothetical protein